MFLTPSFMTRFLIGGLRPVPWAPDARPTPPPSCPTARCWWREVKIMMPEVRWTVPYSMTPAQIPGPPPVLYTRPANCIRLPSCPTARSWWPGAYSQEHSSGTPSAELYNPDSRTWSTTGSLKDGRYYHTATLLSGGRVLVAGGWYGVSSERAELYRPSTLSAILSLFLLE